MSEYGQSSIVNDEILIMEGSRFKFTILQSVLTYYFNFDSCLVFDLIRPIYCDIFVTEYILHKADVLRTLHFWTLMTKWADFFDGLLSSLIARPAQD